MTGARIPAVSAVTPIAASDGPPLAGWPVDGLPWRMIRVSDETGVSGVGIVVQGLLMCDGSVVSWWVVDNMPPRPHVDSCWRDFYTIHISKHPSNGSVVETKHEDSWVPVTDVGIGPMPAAV